MGEREGSTERPLKRRCDGRFSLAICPENDSPRYGFIRSGLNYEHHVRITRTLCLICVFYSTIWSRDHSEELTDARYEAPFSMKTVLLVSQLSVSTLPLSLPFFKLRLQTGLSLIHISSPRDRG